MRVEPVPWGMVGPGARVVSPTGQLCTVLPGGWVQLPDGSVTRPDVAPDAEVPTLVPDLGDALTILVDAFGGLKIIETTER